MLKVASFNLVAGRLQDADDTDDHWTDECLLSETNPAPPERQRADGSDGCCGCRARFRSRQVPGGVAVAMDSYSGSSP